MKSTAVLRKKRRRGRPKTVADYDPITTLRLPPKLAKALDAWAKNNGVRGRSEAIRQLMERALSRDDDRERGGTGS
jgi:hypothetical protein